MAIKTQLQGAASHIHVEYDCMSWTQTNMTGWRLLWRRLWSEGVVSLSHVIIDFTVSSLNPRRAWCWDNWSLGYIAL